MDFFEPLFILLTGLSFGSFITLASYRLPREEDIVLKPSRCPNCDTTLKIPDLFPLFSWLRTHGSCRHCNVPIHWRYPLTELITALSFFMIYLQWGFTPECLILCLMATALLIMIVVDFEHYIIPDAVHLWLLPLGMVWHVWLGHSWEVPVYGFLLGAAIGLTLHHGFRWIRKKEGLGFGDVKFLAVAGLWLGLTPMVPFLFYSGILGVITGLGWRFIGHGAVFPFGPALALSLFICIVFPETVDFFWSMNSIAVN